DPEAAFQRLRRRARNTARPIAEVAGEVIAQAHAGDATSRARVAAAGSARRLAELEQVAAGFAAARTPTTVARLVVDRGLRVLDAQAGLIGLTTADGQALELVAWAGYPVQVVAPWRRIPLEAATPLTEVAFQLLRHQARNTARPMVEVAAGIISQARQRNTPTAAQAAAARSARRLAELEQVAVGFAAARTSTTVARLLVDRGLRALDAQAGLVGLNTADGQVLELVAWAGYPVQVVTPWRRIPLEAPTPLTEVARNGGAIWLSTTEDFQARYPDVPVVVEHQAHVAIGLVVEGRPAGALGISFLQARSFSEVDRRFVQALASHCAQALERVRLAEQARAARTKLATAQARALTAERAALAAQANALRAREQASYLAEVSAMLASTTDVEAVLEQMAWLAVPRLGDWCQIHLRQPDGTTRHHTIAHSDPADAEVLARLTDREPLDLTGAHLVAHAEQPGQAPLLLDQLDQAVLGRSARDADYLELLTALNLGSAMVVPLPGRTRMLGTITFASHQPGRYTQADLTLAQNLARRTATAIEHADRAHHPNPPTPTP
ncbi:MAG TPA: GAF domain-containing protein, partial [Actinomycetes bacterium]|nr:GAF domain-containing protein [Actinomycetes bacterium]